MNGIPPSIFVHTRWLVTLACLAVPLLAQSSCLPLPDHDLRDLNTETAEHPALALSEASSRLERTAPSVSAIRKAQLYAIAAEAHADLDHADLALANVRTGLDLLQTIPTSASSTRVRLRLSLLRAELQSVTGDATLAGAGLDRVLIGLPEDSLDRACVLSQRAIAYDFAAEPEHAVEAALKAYHMAVDQGWNTVRVDTAYTLAVNFRRAGIYDHAEEMINEVIALETAQKMVRSLSQAYYERGQLLVASGRYLEANAALEKSKAYAVANSDALGAAAANLPLCLALLNTPDLSKAESTCKSGQADLIAGGRDDLAALLESYNARLDLERRHPVEAIAKFDAVLKREIHRLLPVQESQIYRDRGRAYAEIHEYTRAFADISRAESLDTVSGIESRHRQVAMLSIIAGSDRLRIENRLLATKMQDQKRDLDQQRKARFLLTILAVAMVVVFALLAALMLLGRRHTRLLRRYKIILNEAWRQAPHPMLMIDDKRRVCVANRPLFNSATTPKVGVLLSDVLPACLFLSIKGAIDCAFETGSFVSLDLEVLEEDNIRYYELFILPAMVARISMGAMLQFIDVTESRAVERQFLDGASRERQRLGGEIHEGLAQELAGVSMMLSHLASKLKRGSVDCAQLAGEVAEHVAHSIAVARRMAHDLAPVTTERGSLEDALQQLMVAESHRLGIAVSCEYKVENCAISQLAADHIYHFCREGLICTAGNDGCESIQFELLVVEGALEIQMAGICRGVPLPETSDHDISMKMMAFRARLLRGKLTVKRDRDMIGCKFYVSLTIALEQLRDRVVLDEVSPASVATLWSPAT